MKGNEKMKVNYNAPSVVRHLVVNGCSVKDTGVAVEVQWQWHVASCEQTDRGFVIKNAFVRGDVKYYVWVSKRLGRDISEEMQRKLVTEHYSYTLNPFGLPENE